MDYLAVHCRWHMEIVTTVKGVCAFKEGEFGCSLAVPYHHKQCDLLPNSISVALSKDVPVAFMVLYG